MFVSRSNDNSLSPTTDTFIQIPNKPSLSIDASARASTSHLTSFLIEENEFRLGPNDDQQCGVCIADMNNSDEHAAKRILEANRRYSQFPIEYEQHSNQSYRQASTSKGFSPIERQKIQQGTNSQGSRPSAIVRNSQSALPEYTHPQKVLKSAFIEAAPSGMLKNSSIDGSIDDRNEGLYSAPPPSSVFSSHKNIVGFASSQTNLLFPESLDYHPDGIPGFSTPTTTLGIAFNSLRVDCELWCSLWSTFPPYESTSTSLVCVIQIAELY
ncbi:unnamed protein product [Anisakis simplex]|uniref:Uncharacterized protein n=1 Tax=Anisakis simplex TaxID=6269 RepID=A0A0M3K348_ANISI|nr:unnamed protein product [Anisakis simplex]